jgi:iron complex outermembrane recepter protein
MKKFSARPLLLTTAVLLALPAYAQTTPATPAKSDKTLSADDIQKIKEVIVTARRVGERIQDVPLSIVALTGKDLAERGITNITELSTFTPGLSYSPDFGRSAERPVIRGISALRTEAPQPVSVFFNGVFVRDGALSLGIDDAQRIEVVKGPQSALYGRSTYAGAINYITVKPGNELEGRLSTTVAGSGERSVFGAVTIPFSPDVMSARLRAKSYQYAIPIAKPVLKLVKKARVLAVPMFHLPQLRILMRFLPLTWHKTATVTLRQ